MAFSKYKQINRYRKHGKKVAEKPKQGGFDIGYIFELGTIPTLKAAKALFIKKHKL